MGTRARVGQAAAVLGVVAATLAGCGSPGYCAAVSEYGTLPTDAPTDPSVPTDSVSEYLAEIVELAPPAIKQKWEEFVAGLQEMVEAGDDPDQEERIDELSSRLQAIAEELSVDAEERCS